ncbi:chemotaxis protein CheA [Alteromonas sp. V450]|uniref:chemotaxis protein CheA n=1 Tax=Alteromonas sp. V450 TaxID=1912139 RepID=UPI0008FF1FC7|nr:chemotaxis protein CheA [Alteromonas sp. V450]OJF69036.1 chemotaxis protein CheA [Alteromonas sp. V450]
MSELLDVFIGESRENLESASQELIEIQASGPSSDKVDKIFRDLHTIKGSSDLFDIKPLTRLAHAAEDLLDSVRAKEVDYNDEIGDLLLEALDQISMWFDELENGTQSLAEWQPISTDLSAQLRAFIDPSQAGANTTEQTPAAQADSSTNEIVDSVATALDAFDDNADIALLSKSASSDLYVIEYTPDEGCFFRGEDPVNVALALPGLRAFEINAPAMAADADVYQCVLKITALGEASEDAVVTHMAYYEGQYKLHKLTQQALKYRCKDKILDSVAQLNDEALNDALKTAREAGDNNMLQSTAGLLLASQTHAMPIRAVLSFLSSDNDLTFLDEVITADESDDLAGESDSLAAELSKEGLLPHEKELLTQQLALISSEGYNAEFMFPSISMLVGNVLKQTFSNEAELISAINAALEDVQNDIPEIRDVVETTNATNESETQTAEDDASQPAKAERQAVKMLKVDQTKIDYLMDIVGELTVAKNSLPYLAKQAEEEGGSKKLSKQIKAHFSIVNRLTESLQSAVLQIRMVPVSHVFQRYPRLVRDLSRKLDKKIELCMQGEDTEFDKNLIESLSEPLIHLLRNSIDHGIESPEDRIEAGKPETGRIDLIATPLDDSVIIEIRDDGKGIDPHKIKLLAFQKGVITESQLESIDDNEALQLIFAAGFSTSEQVSDLSGRGVGMDAVKTMVSQAGGTIEMQSEVGVGSTFKLLLPQTMSVNRVMMFEVNDQMFGVSMDAVVETVKVPTQDIQRIRNENVLVIRDKLIPLCNLRDALGFEPDDSKEEHSVLVVSTPQGEFGLIIDKFHEGIDVIQKPLEGVLAGYSHFSGTALLGDGRVLLIINVQEVISTCL